MADFCCGKGGKGAGGERYALHSSYALTPTSLIPPDGSASISLRATPNDEE